LFGLTKDHIKYNILQFRIKTPQKGPIALHSQVPEANPQCGACSDIYTGISQWKLILLLLVSLSLLSMMNALLDLVPTSHQHRTVLMKKKPPTYLQLLIHRHKRNPKAILLLLPNLSISKLRISFSCCPTCKLLFPKSTQFYAFQPE